MSWQTIGGPGRRMIGLGVAVALGAAVVVAASA